MKVKIRKNGSIKMTAQSLEDSLAILKFLSGPPEEWEPWQKELIERKQKEIEELKNQK